MDPADGSHAKGHERDEREAFDDYSQMSGFPTAANIPTTAMLQLDLLLVLRQPGDLGGKGPVLNYAVVVPYDLWCGRGKYLEIFVDTATAVALDANRIGKKLHNKYFVDKGDSHLPELE